MLGWRLGLSAVIIPALWGVFWLDHRSGPEAWILLGLCLAVAARCAWETVVLLRVRNLAPALWVALPATLVVVAAGWTHRLGDGASTAAPIALGDLGGIAVAFSFAVLWVFLAAAIRYEAPGTSMETAGAELLAVAYVGLLLAVTAQLRWVAGSQAGYLALGSLVVTAKGGDVGAYTFGRLFGKRKMSPKLSPGKTWAGAFGGVLAGALSSAAWLHFAPPAFDAAWRPSPFAWSALYGAIVAVAGIVGDLCESLIKRDVGKKDAAPLMPGFGGLLDLVDSVLYAGPVALVLWRVLPLR